MNLTLKTAVTGLCLMKNFGKMFYLCLALNKQKPYLPMYKSTFYSLKIRQKNCSRFIHGSKTEIKKGSGQISIPEREF